MFERDGVFIDNRVVSSVGGSLVDVRSPATNEVIGRATMASEQDVARAVSSARAAFDDGPWPRMSVAERRAIIARAGELLAPRSAAVSDLVTSENGVIIRYQQGEVGDYFDYWTQLPFPGPERRGSAALADPGSPFAGGGNAFIVREPVGVVGAITPWNGPCSTAVGKVLPSLLAGCSVVLKSAPETPLQDYVMAEAFAEAGLPPGVFNVLAADREVSESLVANRGVDMISFTGSTAAGRKIGAICGEQIKRAVLELGGKSAAIVLDDVDVEAVAATVLHTGMLLNNGEACIAWTRILVPRSRHDELVEAFVAVLEQVKVGDPLDPATDLGPLVAERQRDRVEGYIQSGQSQGAKVVFGGGRPAGLDTGWFVEPTLFVNAENTMKMCREEIFGPVGTVIAYDDQDDAIRIANDTNYGLAGSVFSSDVERGRSVAGQIRAGTVSINTLGISKENPFGGYKDSGLGRMNGPEGLDEYLELKTISFPAGYEPQPA